VDKGVEGVGGNRPVQFWRCRAAPAPEGVPRPGCGGVSNPPREGDEGYGLAEPRRRRLLPLRADWGGGELVAGSELDGRTSEDDMAAELSEKIRFVTRNQNIGSKKNAIRR
jgi:hypothetical protein